MGTWKTWAIVAALAIAGCAPRAVSPLTAQAPAGPLAIARETLAPAVEVAPPVAEADGTSRLSMTIRWPKPRSYAVAAIPHSVQAMHFAIKQGDTVLASKLVTREPGAEVAIVSFRLKAAADVRLVIRAYREFAPDLGAAQAIAEGVSDPFSLVPSKFTNLSVGISPLFPPSIVGMTSGHQGEETTAGTYHAGAGDEIVLTGSNFRMEASPSVYFPRTTGSLLDTPPVKATRLSDTELRVRVPAQAASGKLLVVVDGIGTETPEPLWIPALTLDAPKQPYDNLPADNRMIPDEEGYTGTELTKPIPGSTITLTASVDWVLPQGATQADVGTPPIVTPTWVQSSDWAGWRTPTGRYTMSYKPRTLAPNTMFFSTNMHAQVGSVKSNTLILVTVNVCQAYGCP